MRQIETVLDHANRQDLNYLKQNWHTLIQHVENEEESASKPSKNSEPVAASSTHVLIKFDEEIHCDMVNNDDAKGNRLSQ